MRTLCLVSLLLCMSTAQLSAQDADPRFDSTDPAKTPFVVPLSQIEKRINSDRAADSVRLTIEATAGVLRLDVIEMPGATSVAAATRLVFMTARLAKPDYIEMRFADEGEDLFVIDGPRIREIGRQFVWSEEGQGQNPIHLLRLFVDALRYPDGSRVAPPFPGSLFGDTSTAIKVMADVFNPRWVIANTKIR